jgi:hypothetical protein
MDIEDPILEPTGIMHGIESRRGSVMDEDTNSLGETGEVPNDGDSDIELLGESPEVRDDEDLSQEWKTIIRGINNYMEHDNGIRVDMDEQYYREVLFVAN